LEAFINKGRYLDHADLSPGIEAEALTQTIPQMYVELSGAYDSDNTWEDKDLIYNKVMFNYRRRKAEAHQWMLHIVANFTGLAISSIWPLLPAAADVSGAAYERARDKRLVYNRVIYPLDNWDRLFPSIAVLWCNSQAKDREPNHFVPVVP
jgi:hypothetical protein